jgi:hypothetical protein
MKLSRRVSWFLLAFGVWSWVVWTTFVKNLWKDASGLAFRHGDHAHPTAYFWIHLTLAVVSTVLGTAIGVLGARGLRALRGGRAGTGAGPDADPGTSAAGTGTAARSEAAADAGSGSGAGTGTGPGADAARGTSESTASR